MFRSIAYQAVFVASIAATIAWLAGNLHANLAARGLASGYGFLIDAAGFAISEGPIAYAPGDSYLRAFAAGAANTLVAAIPALALTTLIGTALGIASIARNALLRAAIRVYVDVARNVPLLVQALFWYISLAYALPDSASPAQFGSVYFSKNGMTLPPLFGGAPVTMGMFGLQGGTTLSTELIALVSALAGYSSAYCAEIVRSGLLAIDKGQWEAAASLGLARFRTIRQIILPQALRIIFPPYISLAMNVIKNSSLGVAIGYPEIVSVGTTSLNQSGRAIECISIVATLYLALNLLTSVVIGFFERRARRGS